MALVTTQGHLEALLEVLGGEGREDYRDGVEPIIKLEDDDTHAAMAPDSHVPTPCGR